MPYVILPVCFAVRQVCDEVVDRFRYVAFANHIAVIAVVLRIYARPSVRLKIYLTDQL